MPTLPLGSGSLSMLRTVTPLNSPTRGGVFTSSRPPSAMDARFDEEVTFDIIQYSALSKRPLGKNHFLLTYQNLSSQCMSFYRPRH